MLDVSVQSRSAGTRQMSGNPPTHPHHWAHAVYLLFFMPYFFTPVSPSFSPHLSKMYNQPPTNHNHTQAVEIQETPNTAVNGTICRVPFPGLFASLSRTSSVTKVGQLDALQGQSVALVTSSYWGDVDHAQIVERGLEAVYSIVTNGKQFRELKFHSQVRGEMLKQ